jgi:hypothetical protein
LPGNVCGSSYKVSSLLSVATPLRTGLVLQRHGLLE